MIFEKEMLSFHILDVIELKQNNVDWFNTGRTFSALSFRFRSDALLKSADAEHHLKDNCVAYVPPSFDYTRIASVDELIVIHFDMINYKTQFIECFECKSPERLIALFRDILTCWNSKKTGYQLRCAAILYEIFAECYSQNFQPERKTSKIQKSVDYMFKEYKRSDLTIQEIAQLSFISEVYFRKLFKAEYGVSPQKYIVDLRIQNAVGLIATGYYSLKEVAYMSGYNDYKYFSTEFKKLKGVSPSEYSYHFQG